ncbi:hypothetical protein At1g04090-like [Syzygium oleosum]|uniref:hypothetical protein At1g04090-like n=1 Tax=Syzygium oleosum TaxID=219896 RepID=UPI0011D23AA9|nr:hypothetical protein At1g04090-like [Syzygium oleosum]
MHPRSSLPVLLLLHLLLSCAASALLNTTSFLSQYSHLGSFSRYLAETGLADSLIGRTNLTVLAVDDAVISRLSGESRDVIRRVLSMHLVAGYYDLHKLRQLPSGRANLSTLFQENGNPQGSIEVAILRNGGVAFGSNRDVRLLKAVAPHPHGISLLQISDLITKPQAEGDGNCLTLCPSARSISKKSEALPVDTVFKLPSPLPTWPAGGGFASGTIDFGGLLVYQTSSFSKVWAVYEDGPDNLGATFLEPSSFPEGYFMFGSYAQPNNRPLSGWVLVGKDQTNDISNGTLKKPVDYSLIWSSNSSKIKQDGSGYIWLPIPPDGYKAVGQVVTTSPEKPSLDKVRCVRSDLTDQCETETFIWGSNGNTFSVFSSRPSNRGIGALAVSAGTFIAQNGQSSSLPLSCLRNAKYNISAMPNRSQIEALIKAYSPVVYFHPDEAYLPSSVDWFFTNGGLLYTKGQESKPVPVEATGSNLPQGGSNDGAYWLDLPLDGAAKDRVKKGYLQSAQAYMHVKPMLGATFTDIAIWLFYPFNGPARAKVKFVNLSLGRIGEHVGDWEHVTLRISNFNGQLWTVYFSEHGAGIWVGASGLEFQNANKFVVYASLHGHAAYMKPGTFLQGSGGIGMRNDFGKSSMSLDTGTNYSIIAAEHLGSSAIPALPWLNYCREWGPRVDYDAAEEMQKAAKALPGKVKTAFRNAIRSLPPEVLKEEGPTGPKMKPNWNGDEA